MSKGLPAMRTAPRHPTLRGVLGLASATVAVALACGPVDSRKLDSKPGTGAGDTGAGGSHSGTGGSRGGSKGGNANGSTGGDTGANSDSGGGGESSEAGRAGRGDDTATCGNGLREGSEQCDDGNLQLGDGCDAQCRKESCGNGRVDAGEECDPPKSGSCANDCTLVRPRCGDHVVQTSDGEQCDDGNDQAGDGCLECRLECGDGRIDASIGEECEAEYSPAHCSSTCRWLPACGDGAVQPENGEECDPSNGVTCVACKLVSAACGAGGGGGAGGCGDEAGCVPSSAGLVQNGSFDGDTAGWLAQAASITLALAHDGKPNPGALAVSFAASAVRAESGAIQCVPISGGRHYDFSAQYRIAADTPDGVGAAVVALPYANGNCSGQFTGSPALGPLGVARDNWTTYDFSIDATALQSGAPASLALRLDVVRPANVDGAMVEWDSVSLNAPGPRCGDCRLDSGEECDDGNRTAGDGCSASCTLERCGDALKTGSEQCDDGNTTFGAGDTCTPDCRTPTACDTCSGTACASALDGCFGLTGVAEAGPGAGLARSTLCDELLTCVRNTDCDLAARTVFGTTGPALENCYCGTNGDHCFDGTLKPNGSCRAETEAALETTNPNEVAGRFDGSNANYPAFAAVHDLIACDTASCKTECARSSVCGDGQLEDRNLDFTFVVNQVETPCDDTLTATGHGCSVEECDDGNTANGDGCDQHCFLEVCGNNVVQAGEECDDGNRVSKDGCSADCKAEYHCGDGNVESPFEQCDPPRGGDVCSADESKQNPAACACDANCQLAVCGNGVVQKPYEDCDPPDGATCGADCKAIGRTACETCIAASSNGSVVQATYCDPDPTCLTVERCAITSKCFNPLPVFCYCGITDRTSGSTDAAVCSTASFTPTGPCVDDIKAGFEAGATNDEIVNGLLQFGTSAGSAFGTLNLVFATEPQCTSACF